MRKRATRIALTLVVLASMSLTLGAGMRWAAHTRFADTPGGSVSLSVPEDGAIDTDVVVTSDTGDPHGISDGTDR